MSDPSPSATWFAGHGVPLLAVFAAAIYAWAVWTVRPLLRVTIAVSYALGGRIPGALLFTNPGGPAFSIVVVNADNAVIAALDMLDFEVLQQRRGISEQHKAPSILLQCTEDFTDGRANRIYYQDVMGWWHVNTVRLPQGQGEFVFHGGNRLTRVPAFVRRRGLSIRGRLARLHARR